MIRLVILLTAFAVCACGGNSRAGSEPKMSEKAKIIYQKTENKIADLESSLETLHKGADVQQVIKILTDVRKLEYSFDSTEMNRTAINMCKDLQRKVEAVQIRRYQRLKCSFYHQISLYSDRKMFSLRRWWNILSILKKVTGCIMTSICRIPLM